MVFTRHRFVLIAIALSLASCKPGVTSPSTDQGEMEPASPALHSESNQKSDALALSPSGRKIVRVCIDEVEAFPLAFQTKGEMQGIYVDISRAALNAAGFDAQYKFLPWRRCVEHELKTGLSDTALSVAWNEERETFLRYPKDAQEFGPLCKSPSALICNGPVLLVPSDSSFTFTGDYSALPQPVRVTLGYSQADEFRARGLAVDEGPGDAFNVAKMIRDAKGSVLIWHMSIPQIERDPRLNGRFRLVQGFAEMSDGFLPFSRRGRLSEEEARRVWAELARLRSDPRFLSDILAHYSKIEDPRPLPNIASP